MLIYLYKVAITQFNYILLKADNTRAKSGGYVFVR